MLVRFTRVHLHCVIAHTLLHFFCKKTCFVKPVYHFEWTGSALLMHKKAHLQHFQQHSTPQNTTGTMRLENCSHMAKIKIFNFVALAAVQVSWGAILN